MSNETEEPTDEQMRAAYQVSAMIREAAEREVGDLCRRYGFGCVMQVASYLWRRKGAEDGQPSTGIVTGPHHGLTVPCFCRRVPPDDPNHHEREGGCDWCCGCGWLTKAVANMIEHG